MSQTYELVTDRPRPWSWERYSRWLVLTWKRLLANSPSERTVHRFLEEHPVLVPGGEGGEDSIGGHHGAFPAALISQPELPGLTRPRPDFMWITKFSGVVTPVLIEIERPEKRWFRKSGVPQAHLTQAVDQLAVWRAWLGKDAQRALFYERYGISDWIRRYHKIEPVFCLIYGRRSEFEANPELSRKRAEMRPDWLTWMTFDRLRPHWSPQPKVTAQYAKGSFRVIAIPPTFELGPDTILSLRELTGLGQAIERNTLISQSRREFLLTRLPYWEEWRAQESFGSYSMGDAE
jgi:Domain of unknown function (DUF4263)